MSIVGGKSGLLILVSFRGTGFRGGCVMIRRAILSGLNMPLVIVHGSLNTQGCINQILLSEAVHFIQRQPH